MNRSSYAEVHGYKQFEVETYHRCSWLQKGLFELRPKRVFMPKFMIVRYEGEASAVLEKDVDGEDNTIFHSLSRCSLPAFAFKDWQPITCSTLQADSFLIIHSVNVYDIVFRGIELQ